MTKIRLILDFMAKTKIKLTIAERNKLLTYTYRDVKEILEVIANLYGLAL